MPPKKDSKKEAQARPDNSGIPKQDVEFKFTLTVTSEAVELPFAVMIEWFGATSDKLERIQTPLIDCWKKEQGCYVFEKQCDLIRVDDDFCKAITSRKFFIYFVNSEDNKVEDRLDLDYSSLLIAKGGEKPPSFCFESNTIRVMKIDKLVLKLAADKELIGETFRHYLNPFEVEVIGAKDVPLQTNDKYLPAYVKYTFFDGMTVETNAVVGNDKLLWSHRHVFLAGLINPSELTESLRSKYLKFELHDRDQLQSKRVKEDVALLDVSKAIQEEIDRTKPVEEDPKKKAAVKKEEKKQPKKQIKKDPKKKDAKLGEPVLPEKIQIFSNNYGVAAFYLVDYLKPSMRSTRFKAPVVPKNTFEDFESRNIDLNTTARTEMQKIISQNNYFEQDTVLVVGFNLSYSIGTFIKPEVKEEVVEDPKKKKDLKTKQGKEESKLKDIKDDSKTKEQSQKKRDLLGEKTQQNVFERVIYIVPYKDVETVKSIEDIFYSVNMHAFGLKSRREVSTHILKQEERQISDLDYISGIQIIDTDGRLYILEGLKDRGITSFHRKFIKTSHNTNTFKILKNSNFYFMKRVFSDFNIELKRIRMRPSLNAILLEPSIYIKSKVPEQISSNLNKLNQIRKLCDDLTTVDTMNLWPEAKWLVQIQRKFSQSLTNQDITGEDEPKDKTVNKKQEGKEGTPSLLKFMEHTELKFVTNDLFSLPNIFSQETNYQKMNQTDLNIAAKRSVMRKTFTKDESKMIKTFQMKGPRAQIPTGEQVYIYAGQKLNFYDKQMRQMRQKMHNNPNLILTYSKDYLGLSIDPFTLAEEGKRNKEFEDSLMYSKNKFSSLLVRTKEERMRLLKKPAQEDIQQLAKYPYHEQKALQKSLTKNERGLPLDNGKDDFKKYIKKKQVFSQPEVVQDEVVSPVEKEKLQRQQKKLAEEETKKKMLGSAQIKIKKGASSDKATGTDRFKDIREDAPHKLGIIDINKKTKTKRPIQQYEISVFKWEESKNPLVRKDHPQANMDKDEFNYYQRPEILTSSMLYKPLKKD